VASSRSHAVDCNHVKNVCLNECLGLLIQPARGQVAVQLIAASHALILLYAADSNNC
jgi:hypothetical protein